MIPRLRGKIQQKKEVKRWNRGERKERGGEGGVNREPLLAAGCNKEWKKSCFQAHFVWETCE